LLEALKKKSVRLKTRKEQSKQKLGHVENIYKNLTHVKSR